MASHTSKPSQKEVEWGQGCHSWSPLPVYKFLGQLSCSVNPDSEKLNSRKSNQNKIKNYDVSQYLSNLRSLNLIAKECICYNTDWREKVCSERHWFSVQTKRTLKTIAL